MIDNWSVLESAISFIENKWIFLPLDYFWISSVFYNKKYCILNNKLKCTIYIENVNILQRYFESLSTTVKSEQWAVKEDILRLF